MLQDEIVRAIDRAQFEEGCWERVLTGIMHWTGAQGAYLWSPTETSGVRSFGQAIGLPAEMGERYFRDYHDQDLLLGTARARGLLSAGTVINTEDLVPREIFENSAFYRDFLRDYGMYTFLVGVLTDEGDAALGPRAHVALSRPRDAAPFDGGEEHKLASVLPQMRTALTSHWRMRNNGLLGEWNEQLLAQIDQPFLLLSRGGRLLFANRSGLDFVRDGQILTLRDGILCRGADGRSLVACFGPGTGADVEPSMCATESPSLKIVALAPGRNTRSMFRWFPRAAYVVLPQTGDAQNSLVPVETFCLRHRLTRGEGRVLGLVVEGRSPRAVSDALGLSVHTVRAHLTHIFQKTGLRNQRELLAAVWRGQAE